MYGRGVGGTVGELPNPLKLTLSQRTSVGEIGVGAVPVLSNQK